jgi:hypothetical protein
VALSRSTSQAVPGVELDNGAPFAEKSVGYRSRPHVATARWIETQYAGPKGAEEPGADGTGDHPGEVEDPHLVHGPIGGATPTGSGAPDHPVSDEGFRNQGQSLRMSGPDIEGAHGGGDPTRVEHSLLDFFGAECGHDPGHVVRIFRGAQALDEGPSVPRIVGLRPHQPSATVQNRDTGAKLAPAGCPATAKERSLRTASATWPRSTLTVGRTEPRSTDNPAAKRATPTVASATFDTVKDEGAGPGVPVSSSDGASLSAVSSVDSARHA